MLLRVGIDKGTDGALGPIFSDGSFEYIPLSEKSNTSEKKTFSNTKGLNGMYFTQYLPEKIKKIGNYTWTRNFKLSPTVTRQLKEIIF